MTAQHTVLVSGVSFGSLAPTVSGYVGTSACATSSWVSATSVACVPSGGQGVSHTVGVAASTSVGTRTLAFSYDGASCLACYVPDRHTCTTRIITLFGDAFPRVHGEKVWTCIRDCGMAIVAPVVSFVTRPNAVVTAGLSTTVSGTGFGYADTTTTSGIGKTICATTAWVSTSSVACYLGSGSGPENEATVTSMAIVGTQTSAFSYDGSGNRLLFEAAERRVGNAYQRRPSST